MNRWKWLVVVLVVVSLGILLASALVNHSGLSPRQNLRNDMLDLPMRQVYPMLDQHMEVASLISVPFTLGIVGIIVLFAIPNRIRRVAGMFSSSFKRLLRLVLLGFLSVVFGLAVGLSSVLMFLTFPLVIILVGILFIAALIGFIALSFTLGRMLMKRAGWQNSSPLYSFLLGLLILSALAHIPWIGPVLVLIFVSLGLGATIVSNFGSGQPWNLTPLLED